MEKSISEELAECGIIVPDNREARLSLYNYLCSPLLDPLSKQQRIENVLRAQDKFLDKKVCRRSEPSKTGTVRYIRTPRYGMRSHGSFEAYVVWQSHRPTFIDLALIELLP